LQKGRAARGAVARTHLYDLTIELARLRGVQLGTNRLDVLFQLLPPHTQSAYGFNQQQNGDRCTSSGDSFWLTTAAASSRIL